MRDSTPLLPVGLELTDLQIERLQTFEYELRLMNQRINLVSSETENEFWKRHTAHCLALATRSLAAGSMIVDWGTGGGLPAIPLAIVFPNCDIIGVDSVRKKVQSCTTIARRLGLGNCTFVHGRAEQVSLASLKSVYSVSRATAPLATLWAWHTRVARTSAEEDGGDAGTTHAVWPRGLICLKGGDLTEEIADLERSAAAAPSFDIQTFPLSDLFDDSWFDKKVIVQVAETS